MLLMACRKLPPTLFEHVARQRKGDPALCFLGSLSNKPKGKLLAGTPKPVGLYLVVCWSQLTLSREPMVKFSGFLQASC